MERKRKRMVLREGKEEEDCEHVWEIKKEQWEETPGTGPVMEKLPKWSYNADIQVCVKCGREELLGGTVSVPETPGHFVAGLYELQSDEERGMCIE